MDDIIRQAKQTIILQAEAVNNLVGYIDKTFADAVQIIQSSKGRVVVTGVGKSALICQKIVSTFNSTGTPAIFMHAADAAHGDLGMIQNDDVVIIVSKSGESQEIRYITPLIKGLGNKVIAITGNIASYLAIQSHIILNTTIIREACPNNLAPTTSTTVQMVMGDALAICLMQINQFSGKDFAKYHPGGSIGKKLLLKIGDVGRGNSKPSVPEDATLKKVIAEISGSRLGATVVLNHDEKISGIITDGDVRRMLEKNDNIAGITAKDLFTYQPKSIDENELAATALEKMKENDISQLIITGAKGEYAGMVHLHDLLREGIY